MKQTILFLRNGNLFSTLEAAKAGLAGVSHKAGQPVVALYGSAEKGIKLVFAIGTADGSYQIMADAASFETLSGLVSELSGALSDHVDDLAGNDYGHVKTGADINFSSGVGTIKDNAITTAKINDSAVTTAKINDSAVTTAKIGNNAVTYAKLQKVVKANRVLGSKSANGTVTELSASDLFDILKTDSDNWDSIVNSTLEIGTIVTDKGNIAASVFTEQGLTINGEYTTETTTGIEVVAENNRVLLKLGTAPAALKANTLTTERSIGLTGEVTGSVGFDGSKDVRISATIADNVSVSGWTLTDSTASTKTVGDNSTAIATTAFVQAEIASKLKAADALVFKGTVENASDLPTIKVETTTEDGMTGWTYKATKSFELNSQKVEAGDMIICTGTGWTVIQANIDGAVTGPTSSTADHIAVFDGTTGKVIKDGGIVIGSVVTTDNFGDTTKGKIAYFSDSNDHNISATSFAPGDIVLNTRKVSAGAGLSGGGTLSSDVTISHPTSANTVKTNSSSNGFVDTFSIDDYGHIVNIGTSALSVTNGSSESGKYISAISLDADGKGFSVTKTALPAESGKVKVNSSDTANYLDQQIKSHTATSAEIAANKYGVAVATVNGALEMTVQIDTIDGGTY